MFVLVVVSVMYAMLHMIYGSPVLFTDTKVTAVYVFGKLRLIGLAGCGFILEYIILYYITYIIMHLPSVP